MPNSDSNQSVHPEPAATTSLAADQPQQDLSAQQLDFARDLGLEQQGQETDIEFIKRIEQHLGQESMLELARWFLLSVLQYLKGASWNSISESQVETDKQYELAAEYISKDEFKQSLLVVLKDHRLRFTLLGFAKARDPQRRILSITTKAFRRGREILMQHGLVDPQSIKTRKGRKQVKEAPKPTDSTMSRRAARRVGGINASSQNFSSKGSPVSEPGAGDMSEEEFAQLDKVLGEGKAEPGQPFTYHSNEERLSLLLGALAGGGLFILTLWIFF